MILKNYIQNLFFKRQITNLLEDMNKMEDHGKNSCEEICRKLNSIEHENETLNLENTKLQVLCPCVCT